MSLGQFLFLVWALGVPVAFGGLLYLSGNSAHGNGLSLELPPVLYEENLVVFALAIMAILWPLVLASTRIRNEE